MAAVLVTVAEQWNRTLSDNKKEACSKATSCATQDFSLFHAAWPARQERTASAVLPFSAPGLGRVSAGSHSDHARAVFVANAPLREASEPPSGPNSRQGPIPGGKPPGVVAKAA